MSGLRVLIIDNSILEQERLTQELRARLPVGTLIETVADPIGAKEKVRLFHPSAILLSFALAVFTVNGERYLPQLIEESHAPIIAYGLLETSREAALGMGVFDYLRKPSGDEDRSAFYRLLIGAIKKAADEQDEEALPIKPGEILSEERWEMQCAILPPAEPPAVQTPAPIFRPAHPTLIAIGASTGGPDALSKVLTKLTPPMPPIVIVQHIPATFSGLFAKRLDGECSLHVKEAATGDVLARDTVYIAQGGKHMTVHGAGTALHLVCEKGAPRHNCCPSADVLFHSVAETVGAAAAGVILTGMGHDGAAGLLEMREKGSPTIGQDEATSVVYGMPRAAYEIGAVEKQYPLEEIPVAITRLVR